MAVLLLPVNAANRYRQISALVQISSNISDGRYSPEEIMGVAEEEGYQAVVFTDRLNMKWEYGLWPLRNVLKKTVKNKSVSGYGLKKYFKFFSSLQKQFPRSIILMGFEVIPFYYWSGSPFSGELILHDDHRHMLVLGLDKMADIRGLPVIANRSALAQKNKGPLFLAWTLALLFSGVFMFLKSNRKDFRNSLEQAACRRFRILGIFLVFVGALFFINDYPFYPRLFDQYHGDRGTLPYQNLIDYVTGRGGLIFWAHPEAAYRLKAGRVLIETEDDVRDFSGTRDYSGFGILYEGYKQIGCPQGLWDKALTEYLYGERKKPVWAVGMHEYDASGDLRSRCRDLRNIVLVDKYDREGLLEALNKGRLYVLRGSNSAKFRMKNFSVSDRGQTHSATYGQTLTLSSGVPEINIKSNAQLFGTNVTIKLLRNGEEIKEFVESVPFSINYPDASNKEEISYYRVEINGPGLHVITNPVFVKKKGDRVKGVGDI